MDDKPLPFRIFQIIIGLIVALGFFGAMLLVATTSVPTENKELFSSMANQLTGAFIVLVGFAFGSSVGSQRKGNPPAAPGETQ